MTKLSWDPPKWKSYSFDGKNFEVELETGKVYTGVLNPHGGCYIIMKFNHPDVCFEIFGQNFSSKYLNNIRQLSEVLGLQLQPGNWPEYFNVEEFLRTYYEKVAKIEKLFTKSIISIESEIDIIPKFTL